MMFGMDSDHKCITAVALIIAIVVSIWLVAAYRHVTASNANKARVEIARLKACAHDDAPALCIAAN
jgi:hypothetical protein